jgi:hypothetical protein
MASGELQWHSADGDEATAEAADSCIVLNALVTSSKALLATEVGAEINETSGQYYLLVATATRRLTLRTDSSAERDRWAAHLAAIAHPGGLPVTISDFPNLPTSIADESELVFALAPMRWASKGNGGQMVVSLEDFRGMCARYPMLACPSTVSEIYHGLVADDQNADAMLTFDRLVRYLGYLAKSQTEAPAFVAMKFSLGLPSDVPLVRIEEIVQSTTKGLPVNNGTLYLTDTHLIHQAWDLELPLNLIPLASIETVEEVVASGILSVSDTLVLIGVDVLQIRRNITSGKYAIEDAVSHHGVGYRLQFSVLKDMLLASGGGGGRRGLWLDLLSEMALAHRVAVSCNPNLHAASKLPRFVAGTLVQARAIFRTSGYYSRDLLICTSHPDAGRRWVESASSSLSPTVIVGKSTCDTTEELPHYAPDLSVPEVSPGGASDLGAPEAGLSPEAPLVAHQAAPVTLVAPAAVVVPAAGTEPTRIPLRAKPDPSKSLRHAPDFHNLCRTAASLVVLFAVFTLPACFSLTLSTIPGICDGASGTSTGLLKVLRVSPATLLLSVLAIAGLRQWL